MTIGPTVFAALAAAAVGVGMFRAGRRDRSEEEESEGRSEMTLEERVAKLEREVFKFPKPGYYRCGHCERFQSTDLKAVGEHQRQCLGPVLQLCCERGRTGEHSADCSLRKYAGVSSQIDRWRKVEEESRGSSGEALRLCCTHGPSGSHASNCPLRKYVGVSAQLDAFERSWRSLAGRSPSSEKDSQKLTNREDPSL